MKTAAPSRDEFLALLSRSLAEIQSSSRREFMQSKLIAPYQTQLHWEYGANEPSSAWVFADMGERDVVVQFCLGGHGARGCPWGINFRNADSFGQDCGWYETLEALIADWGIEA
jgi:hypothetical protein